MYLKSVTDRSLMVSGKPYPWTWVFNKSLLRRCLTIYTHCGVKQLSENIAAKWPFYQLMNLTNSEGIDLI